MCAHKDIIKEKKVWEQNKARIMSRLRFHD
jgi:hypothetical protein